MTRLKDLSQNTLGILILIILLPLLLVIGALYLVYIPFDIINYHRMAYYRDNKDKYSIFITARDTVKVYNQISKKNLPWTYVRNDSIEYFIKEGNVILTDWSSTDLDYDTEWYFDLQESGDASRFSVEEAISQDMLLVNNEDKEKPAKILLIETNSSGNYDFEKAKECPYFYCVPSVKDLG